MPKILVEFDGMDNIKRKLDQASKKAGHILAQQVLKDTAPYVPAKTVSLSNRAYVDQNTNEIIYRGPYARYLYHGKLMVDPETGSPWAKKGATKVLTDRNLVFNQTVHPQAQDHWFEASKAQNKENWVRVAQKAIISELK